MVGSGIISAGLGGLLRFAILYTIVIVILIILFIVHLFSSDTYASKKPLIPDLVIESKSVNGVQKSDTTYVYHLN